MSDLSQVVKKALSDVRARSFSDRHPELGKMIKCQVCGRRHREIQQLFTHTEADGVKRASKYVGTVQCDVVHYLAYTIEDLDQNGEVVRVIESPFKKLNHAEGAFPTKGKRLTPRGNPRGLQLVELTQVLFPKYQDHYTTRKEVVDGIERNITEKTFPDDRTAMFAARGEAASILRRRYKAVAKKKRQQQQLSRSINRG